MLSRVGNLRFRLPQLRSNYSGVLNAIAFGSACPQQANPIQTLPPELALSFAQVLNVRNQLRSSRRERRLYVYNDGCCMYVTFYRPDTKCNNTCQCYKYDQAARCCGASCEAEYFVCGLM